MSLPTPYLIRQQIDATRLPPSSYRQRGYTFGTFQPFEVFGDADALGNNQLNWISLYLVNKLGNPRLSVQDIGNLNQILSIDRYSEENVKTIKELVSQMGQEFETIKHKIDNLDDSQKLSELKTEILKILDKNPSQEKINSLEQKVNITERLVKQLASKFAISPDPFIHDSDAPQPPTHIHPAPLEQHSSFQDMYHLMNAQNAHVCSILQGMNNMHQTLLGMQQRMDEMHQEIRDLRDRTNRHEDEH